MPGKISRCAVCGKEYVKKNGKSLYCSPECRRRIRNEQMREYMRAYYWRVQKPGRMLAARDGEPCPPAGPRQTKPEPALFRRICIICGRPFMSPRVNAKCCGPECRALRRRWLELIHNARRSGERREPAPADLEGPAGEGI